MKGEYDRAPFLYSTIVHHIKERFCGFRLLWQVVISNVCELWQFVMYYEDWIAAALFELFTTCLRNQLCGVCRCPNTKRVVFVQEMLIRNVLITNNVVDQRRTLTFQQDRVICQTWGYRKFPTCLRSVEAAASVVGKIQQLRLQCLLTRSIDHWWIAARTDRWLL